MSATLEKMLGVAGRSGKKKIYVTHLTVRQSISILIIKLILIDVMTATVFFVSHSILFSTEISSNLGISPDYYNTVIFLMLAFGKIALTIYLVLSWLNEYYEITADSVIYYRGVLFRRIKKDDLVLIRQARVNYGLIGRLFNFGTIILLDIRLIPEIVLYQIHNPLKYLHIFEDLIPDLEEEKKFFKEKSLEK